MDIGGLISGSGIALEQTAYNAFGAATDQFATAGISSIFGNHGDNPFTGRGSNTTPGLDQGFTTLPGANGEWNTTPYATDLINFQPKHRFLFRVIFQLDDSVAFSNLFGAASPATFQYVIKHIDKPTVTFDYEELNYYNFRTKALKSIKHDALSMTMIDDVQNTFYNFFKGYLTAHSPISRTYQPSENYNKMRQNGFAFTEGTSSVPDSASRGFLTHNNYNILKSIKVLQYFANGTKVNEFAFINPRILDFNFDEHSHEGGDQGSHCVIRFDYDALYMSPAKSADGRSEYSAPGTDMNIRSGGMGSPLEKTGNPLFDMISAGLGQEASSLFSGLSNQALSGLTQGNPLISGVVQQTTNAVGGNIRNGIFGMTSGASPGSGGIINDISSVASNVGGYVTSGISKAATAIEDFF